VEGVGRIRHHPLVPKDIPIYGDQCDVKRGKLMEVADADLIGKAAGTGVAVARCG